MRHGSALSLILEQFALEEIVDGRVNRRLEGTLEAMTLLGLVEAFALVADVGAAPRLLAREIHGEFALGAAHDPHHFLFGTAFLAAQAHPLRYLLDLHHAIIQPQP